MELLINAFGELPDESWEKEIAATEARICERIKEYETPLKFGVDVAAKN